ncbi:hypothetical protein DP0968 [Desulfotalea psychrophila LSv54]|uniref:UPF0033 domain-containing protein n=2 Tax=Desulfotalea psychrophila TaxID=84980 RepID=Q6APM7_DESPS|nr:hypothetical protein DP0968 [Desulfotalea psychrophila LSv54]
MALSLKTEQISFRFHRGFTMSTTIDACGLPCPGPVLLAKDAIEQPGNDQLTILLDNQASEENVSRFLQSQGFQVETGKRGEIFEVRATRSGEFVASSLTAPDKQEAGEQKIVVMITSEYLGAGDKLLGEKLMISFIKTLKEMGPDLWQLIFVNGGVKLTLASSPVLRELQEYERAGTIVLACGTCLEHFGLMPEKEVGSATNMLDIVSATQLADKVITIS